jgi:hypothetical protein
VFPFTIHSKHDNVSRALVPNEGFSTVKKFKVLAVVPMAAVALFLGVQGAHAADPSISLSPSSGVASGDTITATLKNLPANAQAVVIECSSNTSQDGCDLGSYVIGNADASGTAVLKIKVKTGKIGNGTCTTTCYVGGGTVDQLVTPPAAKFTFAAAATSSAPAASDSSSAPAVAASTSAAAGAATADPTGVAAGTGGNADRNGLPIEVVVLGALGALAIAGGAVRFARR